MFGKVVVVVVVVVVTDAGTGVGQAVMRLFAAEGARVMGVSRTLANLEQTLALVRGDGGDGRFMAADLSDDAACKRVVPATLEADGRVDSLVPAAGVGYSWARSREIEQQGGDLGLGPHVDGIVTFRRCASAPAFRRSRVFRTIRNTGSVR